MKIAGPWRGAVLCLCALLWLARPPRSALAEEASAQVLLDRAVELFNRGALKQSAQLLEQARQTTREPALLARIHLHLGLNHAADGRLVRAREAFAQALRHDGNLRLDPYQYKPELVSLFDQVRGELSAELRVQADLQAAEVWLDGVRAGPVPFQRTLLAGPRLLEIRGKDGALLYRRQLHLPAGRTTEIEVLLRRGPASATVAATALQPPPAPPARPRRRIWTWVAWGSALAVGAVALGVGLSARTDHASACSLLVETSPDCELRTRLKQSSDAAEYRRLHDAVGAKTLTTNISIGVAGGLAATGLLLYFLEDRRAPERRTSAGPRLSLSPRFGALNGLQLSISR